MGENNGLWGFAAGITLGAVVGIGSMCLGRGQKESPYSDQDIRQGYVNPSKMQIHMQDFYCDGKGTPVIQYNGKTFLLKDEGGKPVAREYAVVEKSSPNP